jgi:hypothetical protein
MNVACVILQLYAQVSERLQQAIQLEGAKT